MSEKNKIKVTDIALNTATFKNSNEHLKPTNINMLFGRNGTGKSTIAKVLKDSNLRAQCVTWNKSNDEENTLIHVYDEDYIRDVFAQADGMPGVFTISEVDVNVFLEMQENHKRLNQATDYEGKLVEERYKFQRALNTEKDKLKNNCWNIFRNTDIEFQKVGGFNRSSKDSFLQSLLTQTPASHSESELQQLYDAAYSSNARTYKHLQKIEVRFAEDISILAEPIIPKYSSQYTAFMNKIQASSWVKEGLTRYVPLSDGRCPFCQQPLEGVLKSIEDSFDHSYEDMIRKVEYLYGEYEKYRTEVHTLMNNNLSDWFPQNNKETHRALASVLLKTMDNNLQKMQIKKEKPIMVVSFEDIEESISAYNSFVSDANKRIEENNKLVLGPAKKYAFEKAYRENVAQMCSNAISEFRGNEKQLQSQIDKKNAEIDEQNEIIERCQLKLSEFDQHATSTRPVVKRINNLLKDTGFQGFSIVPNDKNTYRIMYSDGTVAKTLSEGEKNFICFLYFYFTVMESPDHYIQTKDKDRVVVIDDPVSSMDGESVFVISALVRDMIENCRNAFVREKDAAIGQQIKQIFILTHNAFFFNEIAPLYVDENDIAAFFEIQKKHNVSQIKRCVRDTYPKEDIRSKEVNSLPQQSSYAVLWKEYKTVEDPLMLVGIMRRILEIYFLHDLGITPRELYQVILKDNRELFVIKNENGTEDSNPFRLVSALLRYISYGYSSSSTEMFISLSDDNADAYKAVFKKLFYCMKQDQHYEMMMKRV